jgi:GT2 family glycosyltransferase
MDKTVIITLTYNALPYTIWFLESLYTNTPIESFDLIVVDNNSSDGTQVYLDWVAKKYSNIKIILNNENKGFSGGYNCAFRYLFDNNIVYPYIVQINNDVLVSPNWLQSLINCIKIEPDIGMVSGVSNNIGGNQTVKIPDISNISLEQFSQLANTYRMRIGIQYLRTGILTGTLILFRYDCLKDLGLYPENYGGLTLFDDNYYSLLAQIKGWKMFIDKSTLFWHFGSKTFEVNKIDYNQLYVDGLNKFFKIWKEKMLEYDYEKEEQKWKRR